MKRGRRWMILAVVGVMLAGIGYAGDLDSPAGATEPGSAMYKLEDVYNRLDTGAAGAPSVFEEPSAGPTAGTGRTLNEVMGKSPATNANAAAAGEVLDGKVYWGLKDDAWGERTGMRPLVTAGKTGQTAVYRTGDDGTYQKGVAPTGARFTDHGDGTVTDNLTGLMWTKNANIWGAIVWNTAVDNCEGYSLAGHSDWRLPNLRELQSLIDYKKYTPALPTGHPFTGVQSSFYWSGTTPPSNTINVWHVYLGDGRVGYDPKGGAIYVWPVRGGE